MFKSETELIFNGVEEKMSKSGNPYRVVGFKDPENYQLLEFYCTNDFSCLATVNDKVVVTLDAFKRGYKTVMLVSKVETIF